MYKAFVEIANDIIDKKSVTFVIKLTLLGEVCFAVFTQTLHVEHER